MHAKKRFGAPPKKAVSFLRKLNPGNPFFFVKRQGLRCITPNPYPYPYPYPYHYHYHYHYYYHYHYHYYHYHYHYYQYQ